jgi:hypothetical protein
MVRFRCSAAWCINADRSLNNFCIYKYLDKVLTPGLLAQEFDSTNMALAPEKILGARNCSAITVSIDAALFPKQQHRAVTVSTVVLQVCRCKVVSMLGAVFLLPYLTLGRFALNLPTPTQAIEITEKPKIWIGKSESSKTSNRYFRGNCRSYGRPCS